jgi:hypothetical protein
MYRSASPHRPLPVDRLPLGRRAGQPLQLRNLAGTAARAAAWRDDIDHFLAVPLAPATARRGGGSARRALAGERAKSCWRRSDDPDAWPRIVTQDGRPTRSRIHERGAYRRFESTSRSSAQAGEMAAIGRSQCAGEFEPSRDVDHFRGSSTDGASGCKVIVNEIEEAPHCYPIPVKDAVRGSCARACGRPSSRTA